jgi:hypothetical protein
MRGRLPPFYNGKTAPTRLNEVLSRLNSARPVRVNIPLMPVVLPLKRLEIRHIVGTAFCDRHDVVNLPTILGVDVPIIRPFHPHATGILPKLG